MSKVSLLNPKNAVESAGGGGGFKEGFVRVEESRFKVHQPPAPKDGKSPQRDAFTALCWTVTRLDEDQNPLVNEHEEPMVEDLVFGFGGKSLTSVHPGNADSPDDEEIEDQGVETNTEGNTLYLQNENFRPNKKAAAIVLMNSLANAGFKAEYLDRVWAPDFKGLVCYMKTWIDDELQQKYTNREGKEVSKGTPYKVVDKIVRAPYEKKAGATSIDKGKGKNNQAAEEALTGVLTKMAEDMDGSSVSRKAFTTKITYLLQNTKVDPKLHVPALQIAKNDEWLAKNLSRFGMTLTADGIQIGEVEEQEAA